ncbi:MAG: 50S ribosomal protein L35 [bacterium (Candidatus Stahlbacteria) CG23_combo_of_CG06-09_8_20_14_all_34_7]|nr:MAG: 50S ribosomal protein L35 [bacterium (Candidatus Stahlbacteria) CG23_combo_of_CG06-09_8_20_14_all_34_7]
MPKRKTKKTAAKRFKITGTGKVKRSKAYKSHILTTKTHKRKRNLRKAGLVSNAESKTVKALLQA